MLEIVVGLFGVVDGGLFREDFWNASAFRAFGKRVCGGDAGHCLTVARSFARRVLAMRLYEVNQAVYRFLVAIDQLVNSVKMLGWIVDFASLYHSFCSVT